MKRYLLSLCFLLPFLSLFGDNQTATTTPVITTPDLPFTITIEQFDTQLPNGWQTGAVGTWKGKALFIAGRTNGLHGFDSNPNVNNFPPSAQNTTLYVIDFKAQKVWQRSLTDPGSRLTQEQIDTLSVVAPQFFQSDRTLYISGGYGINTATGTMETKPVLTAVDVPGLMNWVMKPDKALSARKFIRQTTNPLLQVTGGYMNRVDAHHPTLLIFGQNFTGLYTGNSNGVYTKQVRSFWILDNGKELSIAPTEEQGQIRDYYRRRDLNVVPVMRPGFAAPQRSYIALSGVFTESGGIWTVPVFINGDGDSFMPKPNDLLTFKQGMNNYNSARSGLYSDETEDMYIILYGGLTYGYFVNGVFQTDAEVPFSNQVTTLKLDKDNIFNQYLMPAQFPTIISTASNPGNTLLFGTGAQFVITNDLPQYGNDVFALDKFPDEPVVLGYIVGGIQSTLPNTNVNSDSAASPYIFRVLLQKN